MARTQNMTRCPHCGSGCKTIKTDQISKTYREVTYLCTNKACSFLFIGSITPVRTLEASKKPDPNVHIPYRIEA